MYTTSKAIFTLVLFLSISIFIKKSDGVNCGLEYVFDCLPQVYDQYRCTCVNSGSEVCQQVTTDHYTMNYFTCSCYDGWLVGPAGYQCYQPCPNGCSHYCNYGVCSCPGGSYLGGDGKTCYDIDECSAGTSGCNQGCSNSWGSYSCSCYGGYTMSGDGRTCVDINECASGNGGCNQLCNNYGGGYYCSCNVAGYTMSGDGKTCVDVNECATNNGGCNQLCTNSPGSYSCSCNLAGFTMSGDGKTCVDVNECATNNGGCNQLCTNSQGSYSCSCNLAGYTMSGDGKTCVDVNECSTNNGGCNQLCTNSPGSYSCSCNLAGYTMSGDGKTCVDVNECLTNNGGCQHNCTNTPGSRNCSCATGYTLNGNGVSCDLSDFCAISNPGCAYACRNGPTSSECYCAPGYKLNADGKTCSDIDECSLPSMKCATCQNSVGNFTCGCNSGYTPSSDRLSCVDINECNTGNGGCAQTCNNTQGSRLCSCSIGYSLDSNGVSCNDVNECTLGTSGCAQQCNNTIGSYSCQCSAGYSLDANLHDCNDIDECSTGSHNCKGLSTCSNLKPSFECKCPFGYQLSFNSTLNGQICISLFPVISQMVQISINQYQIIGSNFGTNRTNVVITLPSGSNAYLINSVGVNNITFTLANVIDIDHFNGGITVKVGELESTVYQFNVPFISSHTKIDSEGGVVTFFGKGFSNSYELYIFDDMVEVNNLTSGSFIANMTSGGGLVPMKFSSPILRNTGLQSFTYNSPNITYISPAPNTHKTSNLSIHGFNFGNDANHITIYIGRLPCTKVELIVQHSMLQCTVSETNSITNNVVILVRGLDNPLFYYEFTNNETTQCPFNCGSHGTCNLDNGLCDCETGYGGYDCNALVDPHPTIPTPNPTTPGISVKGYGFTVKRIEELGLSREDILETINLELQNWVFTNETEFTWKYDTVVTQNPSLNNISISITIQFFNESHDITFANETMSAITNSVKLSIHATSWKFSSRSSTLRYVVSSTQPSISPCDKQSLVSVNDKGVMVVANQHEGLLLHSRHFSRALVDGRIVKITNRQIGSSDSNGNIEVGVELPFYHTSSIIDPDYTILLQNDEVQSEIKDCETKKKDDKWKNIVIGTLVGVGGAALLVAATIFTRKTLKRKREISNLEKKISNNQ